MYFAVVKLSFEDPGEPAGEASGRRELRQLVEKLRARFKVCAAVCDDESGIAIAALGSSQERLSQTLDAISEFCETGGFGRVDAEQTLMDHIDSIADFSEDD